MVIEKGCRLVLVFRVENVHGPVAVAVQEGVTGGHPVETGGDKVFAGGIEIDASVVLVFAICVGLVRAHNEGDVGGGRVEIIRPTEAVSSSTWTQIAEPCGISMTSRCSQGAAQVQTLSRNGDAVYVFQQVDGCAVHCVAGAYSVHLMTTGRCYAGVTKNGGRTV